MLLTVAMAPTQSVSSEHTKPRRWRRGWRAGTGSEWAVSGQTYTYTYIELPPSLSCSFHPQITLQDQLDVVDDVCVVLLLGCGRAAYRQGCVQLLHHDDTHCLCGWCMGSFTTILGTHCGSHTLEHDRVLRCQPPRGYLHQMHAFTLTTPTPRPPVLLCVLTNSSPLTLSTPSLRQHLDHNTMPAIIGKPAPAFKGQAVVNGMIKEISLEDFKGAWLFVDRMASADG